MSIHIVFQPTVHAGLGHVSRLAAISLAVRELHRDVRELFLVEGHDHGFLQHLGLPSLCLPMANTVSRTQAWSRLDARVPAVIFQDTGESILRHMDASFVMFDLDPNIGLADACYSRSVPFGVCLRKGRYMREYCVRHQHMLNRAALIVIPHEADEVPIPARWAAKTVYTGTIVRPLSSSPERSAAPDILIVGGGGGGPETAGYFNAAIQAASNIVARTGRQACCVTGPMFREWAELRPQPGVSIAPYSWNLDQLMRDSSVVVCQAGYNTVAELLSLGTPAVCWPGPRDFDDQFERAQAAARQHSQFRLCADQTVSGLEREIEHGLAASRPAPRAPSRGAHIAAEALLAAVARSRQSITHQKSASVFGASA